MYFHVYLIYRFTRTFTDHSSVITRCWGFELQNGKSSLKSPQTIAAQDFAPASFLSTPDRNRWKSLDFRRFSLLFVRFFRWRICLTHTVTHTRKCSESGGEDIRLILSAALLFLHHLRHEIAHLFGGAFLHLPCDVGVGAERETCVEMAKHTGYRFHVYAVLQC